MILLSWLTFNQWNPGIILSFFVLVWYLFVIVPVAIQLGENKQFKLLYLACLLVK